MKYLKLTETFKPAGGFTQSMQQIKKRSASKILFFAIALLVLGAGQSAAQNICITNYTQVAFAPGDPRDLVSADFNGDGFMDVAVTSYTSGNMTVYFGNNGGAFSSSTNYALGGSGRGVVAADFNNDGKKDLAVTQTNGNCTILLNNGAGVFTPSTFAAVSFSISDLVSADFNSDSNNDLAICSNTLVYVMMGAGNGTFGSATTYTAPLALQDIVTADFDSDSKADLAVCDGGSSVYVLRNTGTGTFTTAVVYTVGNDPFTLVAADLNNDGKADLATANFLGSTASVLLNSGTGTFGAQSQYATGSGPIGIAAGDFNNDGINDLVTANLFGNNASFFPGSASGVMGTAVNFATAGSNSYKSAVTDLNGDSRPDVVISNSGSNNLTILINSNPTVAISASSFSLCTGNSLTMTASGASSYTWTGGPNTTTFAVSPTVTTTYTLTGTSVTGCTNTITKTVTVNITPTVAISTSTNNLCNGQNVSMIASGASTYSWTGGPATSGYNTIPITNTTYVVVGTAVGGCTATASQAVTVNPVPVISITTTSAVICAGQTTSMTASGANTYTWTSGPSTAGFTVSPSTNTTYTVTGTSTAGCSSNNSQLIVVNPVPALTVVATSTGICMGQSATVTASGANSYQWTGGPATAAYVTTPTVNTTYTVIGTSVAGCTSSATQSLAVNSIPTVAISSSTNSICSGQSINMLASGANSYQWTGGPATAAFNLAPGASTTYVVIGTSANNCTASASQVITVNLPPTISISTPSASICLGKTSTLTASGASTYTWSAGPNTTTYAVTPGVSTTYTVAGTSAAGCTNTASQLVTVNNPPTVVITPASTVICTNNAATLTASGASTYSWSGGPNTAVYAPSPTVNTTYTVNATSAAGCTNTASQSISVNISPTVSISSSTTTVCAGQPATLTASGANTYVWSSGPVTASAVVNPVSATNYTVTGTTTANGCTNAAVQAIAVNTLPAISISATSTLLCTGGSATLSASGANTYVWVSGPASASYAVSPGGTTTYTVNGTNAATGCSNTAVQTVSMTAPPSISISGSTVICTGQTTTLTASGASSYTWSGGPVAASFTMAPVSLTSYTVSGTNAIPGCTSSAVQSVSVNSLPVISITPSSTVTCIGQSQTLTANGGSTYAWSGGPATNSFIVSPSSNTNYTVTGTNSATGCSNTAVQSMSVNALPTVTIAATSTVLCPGQTATLTAGGANTYVWTGGPATASFAVNPVSLTNYTVRGTAATGCTNSAIQTVSLYTPPTINISASSTVICVGQTSTLTASGANTYTWVSGPAVAQYTVSPASTSYYTVNGTNSTTGCTNTAVQQVSVNSLPVIGITSPSTVICTGQSATLTGTGGSTYVWTSGPATSSNVVGPTSTTSYTVTGTSGTTGCTNTAVQSVSVNSLPTVSISASSTVVCAGKTTILTASGASTYTWDSGAQTAAVTVTPSGSPVYTVTGTSAATGCSNTAVRSISVNALPVVNISPSSSVLCTGASATMTASGATTYTWTSGPVNASFAVTPGSTASYTVTGTSAATGCSNIAVQQISVNPLPTLTITASPTVVCAGNTSTLTASGATTYVWNSGTTTNTYAVSPAFTQNFTVTGTDAATGCTNTAVRQVSVNANPFVTTSTTSNTLCSGRSATLTGFNATTYTWSNGPTTNTNAVTPLSTTIYSVVGTNAVTGCTAMATRTITVSPTPTILVITSNTVVCAGQSVTLTATNSSGNYTWTGGPSNFSTYVVVPASTTNYTVSSIDATSNCSSTAIQQVSVNPLPPLVISPSSTVICLNETATLNLSGATTYTWDSGSNAQSYTVSPTSNTGYTVVGTLSPSGCTATATQNMSVNPLPTVTTAATPTILCANKSVTMTAGGASTYTWVGGPASATAVFTPTTQVSYTVNGTSAVTGCSNSAVQSISVHPVPQLVVTQSNTMVCSGSPVNLIATGANTYFWRNGPADSVYQVNPLSTAIYTVTGTLAVSGCTNSILYTLSITPLPGLTVTPTSTFVCPGTNVNLSVSGASNYSWTNGPTGSNFQVSPTVTTTYSVSGVSPVTGCSNTAVRIVNVYNPPAIVINPPAPAICQGKSVTLVASGGTTYNWLGQSSGANLVVSPAANTSYTVVGTSVNNCTNTAMIQVTVNPLPQINISGSSIVCANNPLSLTASGANSYTWYPGASNNNPVVMTPTAAASYTVRGTNGFNCVNQAVFSVGTSPLNAPDICVVTVDSLSINNEIYYEKSQYPQADTFIVYRETSANVYQAIARIPRSAPGKCIDNNRFGLFHGDPNYASYKYKLQYRDSCGNLSPLGPYHQSIFIQDPKTGNFMWNSYAIENQNVSLSYALIRVNVLTGATFTVGGTSANLYTDPNYPFIAATGNVKWYVVASMPICDPDARGKVAKTKSNNTNEKQFPVPLGLSKLQSQISKVSVYPSPANNWLTIVSDRELPVTAELFDATGRTILRQDSENGSMDISTSDIPSGVYLVKVLRNGEQLSMHRIIIQH